MLVCRDGIPLLWNKPLALRCTETAIALRRETGFLQNNWQEQSLCHGGII